MCKRTLFDTPNKNVEQGLHHVVRPQVILMNEQQGACSRDVMLASEMKTGEVLSKAVPQPRKFLVQWKVIPPRQGVWRWHKKLTR